MKKPNENRNLTWLYQDTQDDDFLVGKTPNIVEYAWDDEE
jgi:hypothetical protein